MGPNKIRTDDFAKTLATLFSELVVGASASGAYILNAGDEGLLASLDKLPAAAASAVTPTGSSVAAHVDHLRYGLSLMNRWSAGENPFKDADWSVSWKKTTVAEDEWQALRAEKWEGGRRDAFPAELHRATYRAPDCIDGRRLEKGE